MPHFSLASFAVTKTHYQKQSAEMLGLRLQIILQFLFRLLELSSYLFKSKNSFYITFNFIFSHGKNQQNKNKRFTFVFK